MASYHAPPGATGGLSAYAVGWVGDADSLLGNALTWMGTVSGLVHASGKSAAKWRPRSHRRWRTSWREQSGPSSHDLCRPVRAFCDSAQLTPGSDDPGRESAGPPDLKSLSESPRIDV